jgi:hypothetical protein
MTMVDIWCYCPRIKLIEKMGIINSYDEITSHHDLQYFNGEMGYLGDRKIIAFETHISYVKKMLPILKKFGFKPIFVW